MRPGTSWPCHRGDAAARPWSRPGRTERFLLPAVLALVLLTVGPEGCGPRLKPIFEEVDPPLVWPPEPKPTRIRYLGQLASESDLKAPRSLWSAIEQLLVGAEPPGELYGPRSVVCTPDARRVWIADAGGRRLHLFDLEQRRYQQVERLGGVNLLSPVAICQGPKGSVYVCDSEAVAIYRIDDDDGTHLETLRLPDEILRPVAVRYDPGSDELYVVDIRSHDVKVLGSSGQLKRILGERGTGPGQFNYPTAIGGDGDVLWIVDSGNHRVQSVTRSGEPVTSFGQAGDAPGDLALPKGLAVDSDGHLYVVDARFENVQIFDRSGGLLLVFGEEGPGPGEFWLPAGIFIDAEDRVWVCDAYNRRVQVFQYVKEAPATPRDHSPPNAEAGAAPNGGRHTWTRPNTPVPLYVFSVVDGPPPYQGGDGGGCPGLR